jgi:hypothetical protein
MAVMHHHTLSRYFSFPLGKAFATFHSVYPRFAELGFVGCVQSLSGASGRSYGYVPRDSAALSEARLEQLPSIDRMTGRELTYHILYNLLLDPSRRGFKVW